MFFSKNSRKFATSPSPALGCYWLYKKLPANKSDCTLVLRWELWRSLSAMKAREGLQWIVKKHNFSWTPPVSRNTSKSGLSRTRSSTAYGRSWRRAPRKWRRRRRRERLSQLSRRRENKKNFSNLSRRGMIRSRRVFFPAHPTHNNSIIGQLIFNFLV